MKVNSEAYARMQRHLHGPDWRWQLAWARANASLAPTDLLDRHVCDALDYLRGRAGGAEQKASAARKFAHVAAAERLARNDRVCEQLKVLVLGGCSLTEINERLSVNLKVLASHWLRPWRPGH